MRGSAGGVAEEIVGRAVHGRRAEFVLATKVGMKVGQAPEDEGTSPKAIAAQLRRSLQRMGTDYVDIYYLHCYDASTPPQEIVRAIAKELKAGTIRAWGVSNYTAPQLQALLDAANEEKRAGAGFVPASAESFESGGAAGTFAPLRESGHRRRAVSGAAGRHPDREIPQRCRGACGQPTERKSRMGKAFDRRTFIKP